MSSAINQKQLSLEGFVGRYGGIYENSSWVAKECFADAVDSGDIENLARIFSNCVDRADEGRKLALIRAHPDLAGKAATAGELTEESNAEQASAGIDQCTREEYAQFLDLNQQYKDKFEFPFVMAVRDSNRQEILAAFARRLENDRDTEFDTAISEIHKIAGLRLQEILNERS